MPDFRSVCNLRQKKLFSFKNHGWIFLCCLGFLIFVSENIAQTNSNTVARARIIRAKGSDVLQLLQPDYSRTRALVNAAILELARTDDLAAAWRKIVQPTDRVGIKIHTSPGPVMCTRPAVIEAVVEGLKMAGVRGNQIVIFDRYAFQMENAGYTIGQRKDGVTIMATVPGAGYDPEVFFDFPIPGKLIWGDLEFKKELSEEEQLGTKSHLSRIVTQQIDKLINIATPMTDPNLGFVGCYTSASLSLVDNFRRFQKSRLHQEESLPEIYAHSLLQKKCVLHIMDGLLAQFAGGPTFDPQYCWPLQTVYVSQDPVALDSHLLTLINQLRPKLELPLIHEQAVYLRSAASLRQGVSEPSQIDLVDVPR